jgi:hypothetical protein
MQVLDSLRSIYEHLDDELAQIAKEILQKAPLLSHVSVEYLPPIGYLIAIQEQDQHFLPASTNPSPVSNFSRGASAYNQQDTYQGDMSASVFSALAPSSMTFAEDQESRGGMRGQASNSYNDTFDDYPQQQQHRNYVDTSNQPPQVGAFPPEYQHIYTSEGTS